MRRFRTISRSGYSRSIYGCLLAIVLAGSGLPAYAQGKEPAAQELANRRLAVLTLGLEPPPAALEQILERAGVEGFSLQSVGAGNSFLPRNGKALAGRISDWLKPDSRQ